MFTPADGNDLNPPRSRVLSVEGVVPQRETGVLVTSTMVNRMVGDKKLLIFTENF